MTEYSKKLTSAKTPIPGLTLWDLPVHGDNRGWFKENWQRDKMTGRGLPDFGPIQNNISFNDAIGTTRGIHAEPWDKFVSVATGRIFGVWVDLRAGPSFGLTFTAELDPSRAVFVPRGVGNAFQTLEPNTAYTYLVNDHYSPDARYTSVNLADPTLAIDWPIPLERAELSEKDRAHPTLADVSPMPARRILVLGASGQLGRALRNEFAEDSHVEFADREDIDLSSTDISNARRWSEYDTIINGAAYTAVDTAETTHGRLSAWATNVAGVASLARIAVAHRLTLIHISSDYVFDGDSEYPYHEDDPLSPLGVYGQTKAAADCIVALVPDHYILRTSWVIGDGNNFVRTMLSLANRGINPKVVNDQYGRLTFTTDLARAARHLLDASPPAGTYNLTCSGPVSSWADIARRIFALAGHDPDRITPVTTDEYFAAAEGAFAPRPRNSVLNLRKIESVGFIPSNADQALAEYVLLEKSHAEQDQRRTE